jgi:putative ABC transport system permease protein
MALPVEGADLLDTIEEVRLAMRAERKLALGQEDNFALSSQESVADTFNQLTASIYWVMRIVASIALVVSGVGIMNIMLVVVMERTREIGLRKAVGAPRSAILGQFLVESIVLTMTGGVIGIGFGYLLRFLVAAGTPLPASVPVWAVPLAVGICCTIGVFFGFYPALKASGMDPVEALHYE